MFKFFQRVKDQLERFKTTEVKSPRNKIGKGEQVLGSLTNPYLRKLFALQQKLNDEFDSFKQKASARDN